MLSARGAFCSAVADSSSVHILHRLSHSRIVLPLAARVRCLCFHPSEPWIAIGDESSNISIWNLDQLTDDNERRPSNEAKPMFSWSVKKSMNDIAWIEDRKQVMWTDRVGSLFVATLPSSLESSSVEVVEMYDRISSCSSVGVVESLAYACDRDGKIFIHLLPHPREVVSILCDAPLGINHSVPLFGNWILTVSQDGGVRTWNIFSGLCGALLDCFSMEEFSGFRSVSASPVVDGFLVVAVAEGGYAAIMFHVSRDCCSIRLTSRFVVPDAHHTLAISTAFATESGACFLLRTRNEEELESSSGSISRGSNADRTGEHILRGSSLSSRHGESIVEFSSPGLYFFTNDGEITDDSSDPDLSSLLSPLIHVPVEQRQLFNLSAGKRILSEFDDSSQDEAGESNEDSSEASSSRKRRKSNAN